MFESSEGFDLSVAAAFRWFEEACSRKGIPLCPLAVFGKLLRRAFSITNARKRIGSERERVYRGIKPKTLEDVTTSIRQSDELEPQQKQTASLTGVREGRFCELADSVRKSAACTDPRGMRWNKE